MSKKQRIVSLILMILILAFVTSCNRSAMNNKNSSSSSSKDNSTSKVITNSDSSSTSTQVTDDSDIETSSTDYERVNNLQLAIDAANKKTSAEFVNFSSSDTGFDTFINDFLHRNLRYDDQRIGGLSIGGSVMFGKLWETMNTTWFDTTTKTVPDDRFQMIKGWLKDIPIDKYGYVWETKDNPQPDLGPPTSFFTQGWPFPDYAQSGARSKGYEFNSDTYTLGWSSDDGILTTKKGLLSLNCINSYSASIISPKINVESIYSPIIEIDLRMFDNTSFGKNSSFGNVALYWTTSDSPNWSEDKCVNMNDWCTRTINSIPAQFSTQTYWPMYLHPLWNGKKITQLKLVFTPKTNMKMNANFSLNYFRMNFDTRLATTNGIFISSVKNYYQNTGDTKFLEESINRCRQAMQFYLTNLNGSSGLINQDWFTGHDGLAGVGHGIGGGYWDILSLPSNNIEINMYFIQAIKDLAYLEQMAKDLGINQTGSSIVSRDNKSQVIYNQTSQSLYSLERSATTKFQEHFWDKTNGRFIAGYNNLNSKVDYGFINFNLQAIAQGLATPEQANKIMSWVNGDRIISGENSSGADIYANIFAPRSTTIKNLKTYVWAYSGNTQFGDQVQDGGSVLFISYYDLLSRLSTLGTDNAFSRLKEIQEWYDEVKLAGGVGDRFYRDYYEPKGIQLQGNNTAGGLGLDAEFLESALIYTTIPTGFFGYDVPNNKTIQFTPNLPNDLDYWKIENMMYNGIKYDVTIGKNSFIINSIRGNSVKGFSINIRFKKPTGSYVVKINGIKASSQLKDGYVVVNVPFKNAVVTIN